MFFFVLPEYQNIIKISKSKGKTLITSFINCWKCVEACGKPKGTFLNSDFSNGVTKADFFYALGEREIWWYPELRSDEEINSGPIYHSL